MPCSVCGGIGKFAKNGNHKSHNRTTCTKKEIDFIKEVRPITHLANEINDYLFAPYPSLSTGLKTQIRIEHIKQSYHDGNFDEVLENLTYWDRKELERCRCCHRHHPRREIIPNRWRKKYTSQNKKCACPCRHILRRWEKIEDEEYFDDWEY